MSSGNSEVNGVLVVIALIGAALIMLAVFVFYALVAICAFCTVLAIFAWNQPIEIWGETILPDEARAFVIGGLAGAIFLSIYWFIVSMFVERAAEISWGWIPIIGYLVGSVCIELFDHISGSSKDAPTDEVDSALVSTRSEPPKNPEPEILPPTKPEPFRYATWDDEEELR